MSACKNINVSVSLNNPHVCVSVGRDASPREDVVKMAYRAAGYSYIRKISDYMFECWYDKLDYGTAFEYLKDHSNIPVGGCSGLVARDVYGFTYLGRNFDWFYDNSAEFVVHVPEIAIPGGGEIIRHASIGIANGTGITDADATAMKADKKYAVLPFTILDGMNDAGVMASVNVVPAYEGELSNDVVFPAINSKIELNAGMIVRYVVDNFDNATDAVEFIRDYVTVYFPKNVTDMGYEMHFIVADVDSSYIVEFEGNSTVIIDCNDMPYPVMTNFHLHNVLFNESSDPVYTPYTQDDKHDAIETNLIEPKGSGLERYNQICRSYSSLGIEFSANDIVDIMYDARYSKSYPTAPDAADPSWYTEFVGGELTCASAAEDFGDILEIAGEEYDKRNRSTAKTWHTCHCALYNPSEGTVKVIPQEDEDSMHTFVLVAR